MAEPWTPDGTPGLLEQIADTALDDDYYVVRTGPKGQSRGFNTLLTGVVFGVFALLVAMAAIQTQTDRPATERERATLIDDVDARKASLAKREGTAESLRKRVEELRSAVVAADPAFEELRLLAADQAANGSGIRIKVSPNETFADTITDNDLQMLVNGLWYAGAEAVSINGERIGSLSSIRIANGIMKVNYNPIGPPYEIVALGDAESLEDRFSDSVVGRDWDSRESRAEVSFNVTGSDDLAVEAAPEDRLTIQYAKAIEGTP
jgi:uncharacterized protein YlxW (UPF0749 family)